MIKGLGKVQQSIISYLQNNRYVNEYGNIVKIGADIKELASSIFHKNNDTNQVIVSEYQSTCITVRKLEK